jgi:hypothetical protein
LIRFVGTDRFGGLDEFVGRRGLAGVYGGELVANRLRRVPEIESIADDDRVIPRFAIQG